MFKSSLPPATETEPPPVKRGDVVGAARAGLDVPRVTFILFLLAKGKIGRGDLVADRPTRA